MYGKDYDKITNAVGTKTHVQVQCYCKALLRCILKDPDTHPQRYLREILEREPIVRIKKWS